MGEQEESMGLSPALCMKGAAQVSWSAVAGSPGLWSCELQGVCVDLCVLNSDTAESPVWRCGWEVQQVAPSPPRGMHTLGFPF